MKHANNTNANNELSQLRRVMLYDSTLQPQMQMPKTQPQPQPQPQMQLPKQEHGFRPALNQDPLFWCLYVMMNSTFKYEQLANRFTAEKDGKRDQIMMLRDQGKALKQTTGLKFTGSTMEGDIMSQRMSLHAFQVLVHLNSLNAVFVNPQNRVYAEFISDAVSNKPVHLIKRVDTRLCMTQATDHELTSLRATHYHIENVQKPMKAVSAYTVAELSEMCHRLKLQMAPKTKKQEMYDAILKMMVL